MSPAPPLQLIVGPPGHGVVDYAADIARVVTRIHPDAPVRRAADAEHALELTSGFERAHVHVTDRLWGASTAEAAGAVEALATRLAVSVTLHDVPQPSDGTGFAARRAAYTRFIDVAERVVVNSAHEDALLAEHLDRRADAVIPLGTRRAAAPAGPADTGPEDDLVVLIAGFIYPGKGHAVAIEAVARAAGALRTQGRDARRVVVRAIGRPSPGHEDDVRALSARAGELGVALEVTGFLPDSEFAERLADPGIPLAAHEHVSASRSVLDWVEAGRRPLVVRSRYAEETAALRPGILALYDADRLSAALEACVITPSRTRLAPGTPLGPTVDDAGAAYLAEWAR